MASTSSEPFPTNQPTGTTEAARLCCYQPQVLIHALLRSSLCCRPLGAVAVACLCWHQPYLRVAQSFVGKRLPLPQAFGRAGSGAPVLDALAGLANRLLTADASEVDLHTAVCTRLLPVLVGRPSRCRRLVQLHHWQQLAGGALGAGLPEIHTAVCKFMLLVLLGHYSKVPAPGAAAPLAAAGRWGTGCWAA